MAEYPECEKLSRLRKQMDKVRNFIEWLNERGICLAEHPKTCTHFEEWRGVDKACTKGHKATHCDHGCPDYDEEEMDRLYPTHQTTEKLLAEYFEIDMEAVERERVAMLETIRNEHR